MPPPAQHVRRGSVTSPLIRQHSGESSGQPTPPPTLLGNTAAFVSDDTAAGKAAAAQRASRRTATDALLASEATSAFVPIRDQPWYVKRLAEKYAFCQVLFHPADYATRYQRQKVLETRQRIEAAERRAKERANRPRGLQAASTRILIPGFQFGLPDYASLDYMLVPPEETSSAERTLSRQLGLFVLVHRRRSVHRLSLRIAKANLLRVGISKVRELVGSLLQLDHANVLRCLEVAEDDHYMYFLHEYGPFMTLENAVKTDRVEAWSEGQKANLMRECCAAMKHAAEAHDQHHNGLSLRHILLPATGDPKYGKVFGFGLAAVLQEGLLEKAFWPPEAHHLASGAAARRDEEWISGLPGHVRSAWDSWSVGSLIYVLIEGRLPVARGAEAAARLPFPSSFDALDPSVMVLVEALLCPQPNKRMGLDSAAKHCWFRQSWRGQTRTNGDDAVNSLEAFCTATPVHRAFGQFLVEFLAPRAIDRITSNFYSLDNDGDGTLNTADIETAARAANMENPKGAATEALKVWSSEALSLSQFAACMAEDTIDGKSLRLAFDSIDYDGSQVIIAAELLEVLQTYDSALKIEDVVRHIREGKAKVLGAAQEQTQELNFEEFERLFPRRVARLQDLERRAQNSRETAQDLREQFEGVRSEVEAWMRKLESACCSLEEFMTAEEPRFIQERNKVHDGVQSGIDAACQQLHAVPGPFHLPDERKKRQRSSRGSGSKTSNPEIVYGFSTFMQEIAMELNWPELLNEESANMARVIRKREASVMHNFDNTKARRCTETAVRKLHEVLKSSSSQLREYDAFVDILEREENAMPRMPASGRGLGRRVEPGTEDDLHLCPFKYLLCMGSST